MFDFSEIGSALADLMEERATVEGTMMEVDDEIGVYSVILGESDGQSKNAATGIHVSSLGESSVKDSS